MPHLQSTCSEPCRRSPFSKRRHRSTTKISNYVDEGIPPPPSPSHRRIFLGTFCFCVPTLLLSSSWQTTNHQWNFQTLQRNILFQTDADGKNSIEMGEAWDSFVTTTVDNFHFCGNPRVTTNHRKFPGSNSNESLTLLYQCAGPQYDEFASTLHAFAYNHSRRGMYAMNTTATETYSGRQRRLWQPQQQPPPKCTATVTTSMSTTTPLWGKRRYPLPTNTTVLVLGNSHLRQISKTIACQYASSSLTSIQFLPSLQSLWQDPINDPMDDHSNNSDGFVLVFDNNSQWISITNTVLVYSIHWKSLLEDFLLSSLGRTLEDMNAIVLGKFTTHAEAQHTNFEHTMTTEQELYYKFLQRWQQGGKVDKSTTMERRTSKDGFDWNDMMVVDFASIPPPDLVDLARVYINGPILSVSMFSKSDEERSEQSYQLYQEECELATSQAITMNGDIYLVNGRRYIRSLHMECGTDDKNILGTCHEPRTDAASLSASSSSSEDPMLELGKRYRDPSDMHRCAGARGGHADLIAWDIVEGLYDRIIYS